MDTHLFTVECFLLLDFFSSFLFCLLVYVLVYIIGHTKKACWRLNDILFLSFLSSTSKKSYDHGYKTFQ